MCWLIDWLIHCQWADHTKSTVRDQSTTACYPWPFPNPTHQTVLSTLLQSITAIIKASKDRQQVPTHLAIETSKVYNEVSPWWLDDARLIVEWWMVAFNDLSVWLNDLISLSCITVWLSMKLPALASTFFNYYITYLLLSPSPPPPHTHSLWLSATILKREQD